MVILKVVADTPEPDHGDTMVNPKPVPKASRSKVIAQATMAPAAMAGHETPVRDELGLSPGATTTVSISGNVLLTMTPDASSPQ